MLRSFKKGSGPLESQKTMGSGPFLKLPLAQVRRFVWLAALVTVWVSVPPVSGQARTPMSPARTLFINPPRDEAEAEKLPEVYSSVSFIDSALPRNTFRLRFDWAKNFRRPTLAEFFQPKGGLPFSPGPPRPETSLDYQDVSTYLEYAPDLWFSLFMETPLRFVNPEQNANVWGQGDMNVGFKVAVFQEERFLTTFQLRLYCPTARDSALGTNHFSVEPALLAALRLTQSFQLEGEVRYGIPLGGTDFAGDVLRYGLGLSYGQPAPNEIWITPVVEVVGWSVRNGRALAIAPGFLGIEEIKDQTIINAKAGVRLGLGASADIYGGYSRALTGPSWYRDMIRLELRWHF